MNKQWIKRFYGFSLASASLFFLQGCGLGTSGDSLVKNGTIEVVDIDGSNAKVTWSGLEGPEINLVISATADIPSNCFSSIVIANEGEYSLTFLEPGTDYSVLLCENDEPTDIFATFSTVASGIASHELTPLPEELGGSSLAFGASLAVYNKTLAIGSPEINSVLLYEFDTQNKSWAYDEVIEKEIPGEYLGDTGAFGFTVDLSSDKLLVSAPFADGSDDVDGKVFYYKRSDASWMQQQVISDDANLDGLGISLSLDGDRLAMTSFTDGPDFTDGPNYTDGTTGVSVYDYNSVTDMWNKDQAFNISGTGDGYLFNHVSLSGDRLAVTNLNTDGGLDSDVKIYRKTSNWSLEKTLDARLDTQEDFYTSVIIGFFSAYYPIALERDQLIVSRQTNGVQEAGFDYYTYKTGAGWSLAQTYEHPGATNTDVFFGINVNLSGDSLLASGFDDDDASTQINYFKRSGPSWSLEHSINLDGLPGSEDIIFPSLNAKLWGDMILGLGSDFDNEADCLTVYSTDFDGTFDPEASCAGGAL